MSTFFLTCLFITTFCYGKNTREYTPSSYELQLEITELKHQIRTLKVDMQLIEEQVNAPKNPELLIDCKALQLRIQRQENTIESLSSGIKNVERSIQQLLEHQNKTEAQLTAHENRLQNVSELKNTLANLLKKMHSSTTKKQSYRVQAGDSLEKIAKLHRISVETIKANNKLTSDTIFIGQELQISHDAK
ncbi:MAG: LysM peptidoglycan-binding domain-containing protein [Candidatus Rhabdochlamydia sp.]